MNEGKIDKVIFKARGQAINVAVRASLLLENIMGVMQRTIEISSEFKKEDPRHKGDKKNIPRVISSMEIHMIKF